MKQMAEAEETRNETEKEIHELGLKEAKMIEGEAMLFDHVLA